MKFPSVLMFLAFCAMGSVAWQDEAAESRFLQFDDDSRVIDGTVDPDDITSGPAFPTGTKLSFWSQSQKKWIDGSIIGFQDGNYFVQWDGKSQRTESYNSHYSGDRLQLDTMKRAAKRTSNDPPFDDSDSSDAWANGTPVQSIENGTARFGEIVDFRDGEYKVIFYNGETAYYDDFDILPMVQNAQSSLRSEEQYVVRVAVVASLTAIVLAIILCVCAVRCCCRRGQAQATPTPDPELGLDEVDNNNQDLSSDDAPDKDLPPIA